MITDILNIIRLTYTNFDLIQRIDIDTDMNNRRFKSRYGINDYLCKNWRNDIISVGITSDSELVIYNSRYSSEILFGLDFFNENIENIILDCISATLVTYNMSFRNNNISWYNPINFDIEIKYVLDILFGLKRIEDIEIIRIKGGNTSDIKLFSRGDNRTRRIALRYAIISLRDCSEYKKNIIDILNAYDQSIIKEPYKSIFNSIKSHFTYAKKNVLISN